MKAWYILFAHVRYFNYNDVMSIYDEMHDIGVSKLSIRMDIAVNTVV